MSSIDDAVQRDLSCAPEAPPFEELARRVRRRRVRDLAVGCGSAAVAVLVIVALLVADGSHEPVSVRTLTTPTGTAAPSSPPYATEATVPDLDHILSIVHNYAVSDGPIDSGEIVDTTRERVYGLFGGVPRDHRPIYLVHLAGDFTCNECSIPARPGPLHGHDMYFTVSRVPGSPDDTFGFGNSTYDLAPLGPVYRLPLVSARIDLPSHTLRAGASMKGFVIVRNDTGRPVTLPGCGTPVQVALANAHYRPSVRWEQCLQTFTIPVGSASYPVTLAGSDETCATPPAGGQCPSLPPGAYQARLYQDGGPVVPAAPFAIELTR